MEQDTKIINWEQDIFYCTELYQRIKEQSFVSDSLSYIVLVGRCCSIIVLNVHETSKEKSDSSKIFSEELEEVFHHFPKCHMEPLFGEFNTSLGRANILNREMECGSTSG